MINKYRWCYIQFNLCPAQNSKSEFDGWNKTKNVSVLDERLNSYVSKEALGQKNSKTIKWISVKWALLIIFFNNNFMRYLLKNTNLFCFFRLNLRIENWQKNLPTPGIEPGPPAWKARILTTRPYGTLCYLILTVLLLNLLDKNILKLNNSCFI